MASWQISSPGTIPVNLGCQENTAGFLKLQESGLLAFLSHVVDFPSLVSRFLNVCCFLNAWLRVLFYIYFLHLSNVSCYKSSWTTYRLWDMDPTLAKALLSIIGVVCESTEKVQESPISLSLHLFEERTAFIMHSWIQEKIPLLTIITVVVILIA